MRTGKVVCFVTMLLLSFSCMGQAQKFDLISYSLPKDWKKQSGQNALQLIKQDQKKGTYCIITLYKALDAPDDPKANFDTAWEALVKETLGVNEMPEMQPASAENGWEAHSGYAAFDNDGNKGIAILATSTGYRKMVNMLILTNTDVYQQEMEAFLESITLAKPPVTQTPETTTKTNIESASTPAAGNGFVYSTTNFDDGWTSTVYDDYILTTKGSIKVYLSYIESFNVSDFSGTGKEIRHHYWDTYAGKYFVTGEKKFNTGGILSDFSEDYIEGPATDKKTGELRYIAMIVRVIAYTGTLSIIIASAPDEQQLRRQFPKADARFDNDLLPMYNYNKFAIGKNDLIGKWVSGGGGAMVNWYSTSTGNNVGSTAAVTSDEFDFGNNGKYSSTHNGASGWVGAMNTYQQKYNGAYTVTEWTVTATKRFEGKTSVFNAWFEVVRGGRILHFQDQQYTGQQMSLGKKK